MNSLLPPPRFEMPAGNAPSNVKPTRAVAPGASGAGGVMTYSPDRLSGVIVLAVQVQRGFSQCRPPVSGICRSGLAWLLTRSYDPDDLEPPARRVEVDVECRRP